MSAALIQQTWNSSANLIKHFDFYYVIDYFSRYAWVLPLKDKRRIKITNAFQKIYDQSNHKPNKIWKIQIDKGSEFYNRSLKPLSQDDMEMYSTHNEGNLLLLRGLLDPEKTKFTNI